MGYLPYQLVIAWFLNHQKGWSFGRPAGWINLEVRALRFWQGEVLGSKYIPLKHAELPESKDKEDTENRDPWNAWHLKSHI